MISTRLKPYMPLLIVLAVMALLYLTGIHQPAHADMLVIGIGAVRPLPVQPRLTAISLAYRNPDYSLIAEDVLPGTPVDAEFSWLKYDLAQGFTVPDTKIGRKSAANEVDFASTLMQDKVVDYGLDDLVPNEDIDDDNLGVDPLGTATGYLTNLVQLGREIRVAAAVFNASNHTNNTTLSGTSQWSDTANSDPVAAIGDALDIPVMRPNIAVFGQATWTKLRRHPKIVQAIKNTNQGAGMVSRDEFAEFFELQQVLVGAGFANTAKKGQTAAMSRVWGKHAAFIYRDRAAGPQAGITYGFTGNRGDRFVKQIDEPKLGIDGCQRVRVAERKKEIICAPDLSYFFQNAVA